MRHVLTALLLVLAVAFSPEAFAKAGGGKSMGSRGSRTYDRPVERSIAPPPVAPAQPQYRPPVQAPMMPSPAGGGFFQRNPFLSGMLGGIAGVGIGHMLFGSSSAMAGGGEPSMVAGFIGTLLQLALIGGLVWLVVRMVRGQSMMPAGIQRSMGTAPYMAQGGAPRVEKEFELSDGDKQEFASILMGVQHAWSEGDIGSLRRLATPEMVMWLSDDLAQDASRGVRNVVEDVQLLKGEVTEAWSENGRDFATAALTFAARDYTVRADNAVVVDGDPKGMTQSSERWTFVRGTGGRWLLSAVEQA